MSDTLGEEVTIYREEYDRLVAASPEPTPGLRYVGPCADCGAETTGHLPTCNVADALDASPAPEPTMHTHFEADCEECVYLARPTVVHAPAPEPTGLDAAWAEAEAALPEGWHVGEVKNTDYRGPGERWIAMAWEFGADPDYLTFNHGYGDTPAAALRALAAHLGTTDADRETT